MTRYLPKLPLLRSVCLLVRRYLRPRVGMESAALAFYLLFAAFPFLIFISALVGSLQVDVSALLGALREFLPADVLALAERYLLHVGQYSGWRLLLFGLAFSVYFPLRAVNALVRAVRTAYHLGPPRATVRHWLRLLAYTLVLMGAIVITLVLMTVSDRLLAFAVTHWHLPPLIARLWAALRFPLAAALGCGALVALYAAAREGSSVPQIIWPGAAGALCLWLPVSWGYRWYAEAVADYSVLYGSIGAVIVLLMWLYITAAILILGAEWNGVLTDLRRERRAGEREV